MKRRVTIHMTGAYFKHFWQNSSRFQEIGLRLLQGCLHSFEVVEEKLFNYAVIKYGIKSKRVL
jgi:hypothetical protein